MNWRYTLALTILSGCVRGVYRYNAMGQLTCRVCNTAIKDEGLWSAHIGSKQHAQRVAELKAKATKATTTTTAAPPRATTAAPTNAARFVEPPPSVGSKRSRSAAEAPSTTALPSGFFDAPPEDDDDDDDDDDDGQDANSPAEPTTAASKTQGLPAGFFDAAPEEDGEEHDQQHSADEPLSKRPKHSHSSAASEQEADPSHGGADGSSSIPRGFFDDAALDDQARGVKKAELAYDDGCVSSPTTTSVLL